MKKIMSIVVLGVLIGSSVPAHAQDDYWMRYTEKIPIGSTVKIRTTDGKRLTAVLAIVDSAGMTVQRKTRVPEAARVISFNQLAQVELKEHGASVGKAVAGGLALGAGVFVSLLLTALLLE